MAMTRFRKDMLVSALIIAIAIFLIGLYLGYKLDNFRIDDATKLLNREGLDSESFEVQEKFFSLFAEKKCSFNKMQVAALGKQLAEMGRTLARYDAKKMTGKQSYNDLKRKYFISELRFYNLKKQLDINCGMKNQVVLFFYDIQKNQDSLRQGYVLDVIGKEFNDLVVLSFDKDFDEGAVKVLIEFYGIKEVPAIVVNYKKKFEGFVSEGELRAILNEKWD